MTYYLHDYIKTNVKLPFLGNWSKENIDRQDNECDRDTALHLAARLGDIESIQTLVHYGADLNVKNRWGDTAFQLALLYERKGIADYLKAKGARA